MPTYLTPDQRKFFLKNRHLTLEGLVSDEQIDALSNSLSPLLKKEGKERYLAGHDLFRTEEKVRKLSLSRDIGQLICDTFETKHVQIAFDQILSFPDLSLLSPDAAHNLSSVTPTDGLLFLSLTDTPAPPYLEKKGSALLVHPDHLLDLPALLQENSVYLLIGYCSPGAQYHYQEQDPATHFLKKFGYGFGDKLRNDTHPLIYRS